MSENPVSASQKVKLKAEEYIKNQSAAREEGRELLGSNAQKGRGMWEMLLRLMPWSENWTFCALVCHSYGEFVPCVHALKWWSLGALVPQWHPLTVVISSCVIPHQSLLESNQNSLCSSAHVEHHSTTTLSLELVPYLNCDVLQNFHFLGFLCILNWLSLYSVAVKKFWFSPFYMG